MKKLFTLLILLLLWAGSSWGQSVTVSNTPEKKVKSVNSTNLPNPVNPLGPLLGGETIATATVIPSLPYNDTGTTAGHIDDYNENCPYTGSTAPDVVYSYTPASNVTVDIDLCGSSYDTKVFVYENTYTPGSPFACNDDYYSGPPCGAYVSKIVGASLVGGNTYYIVIDGYSGADYGNYVLAVTEIIIYPVPPNDDCTTATIVAGPFPQTVTGTTLGATVDCPGLLDWNAVWYAVTLPYAINDLTVDWCGTANMNTVGIVYYTTCPVVCGDYVLATSYSWNICGTPPGATTSFTSFLDIPGPATIYYIAYSIPQMDHVLTFNVTEVLCLPPVNLAADGITETSANLTWTPVGTETAWEYVYGTPPLPVPIGSGTATSSSTVNPISPLLPGITYQFYVRADCGGGIFSDWSGPATFTTLCNPVALPLCESFFDITWPACWTEQFSGAITSSHWSMVNSNIAGGTAYEANASYIPAQGSTQADNDRMVSPPINTTGLSTLHLSFRQMLDDYMYGASDVWIKVQSSPDGVNWSDEWVYAGGGGGGGSIPAEVKTMDITNNLGGTTWIAWTLSGNTFDINNWYVDDVCISRSCTWTGDASTAWNDPDNWTCGVVPDQDISVMIPSSTFSGRFPVIANGVTAECFEITVELPATLTVQTGGTLNVIIP